MEFNFQHIKEFLILNKSHFILKKSIQKKYFEEKIYNKSKLENLVMIKVHLLIKTNKKKQN